MNIKDIANRLDVLTAFSKEDASKNTWLSGSVRFKVSGNLVALSKLQAQYNEKRVALIKELGEASDTSPDQTEVKDPEKLKEFHSKIEVLLNEDHDIELHKLSKKDVLGKSGDNQFSVSLLADMLNLGLITK